MKEQFIQLMDGTRLEAKINFGTLYYLQECKADELAKKIQYRQKKRKKVLNDDMMQFSAKLIYATLRSNGRIVTFDEALQLMPADVSELQVIVDVYQEHIEKLKKKTASEATYANDATEINWAEYMICAREMGMSEEEFMHSEPIFFVECYQIFCERKRKELMRLYGGRA